jgi:dephospho-CoA kinase
MPLLRRSARHLSVTLLVIWSAAIAPEAEARQPRQRKRVVVVAGLPGSGKTTLSKSLSRAMKAPRHTCGDVVRGWIRGQGLPYTPQNDRIASQHFARSPGEIARQLSLKIDRSRKPVHIVDGVRSPSDLKVLRERFDVRVVALKLPRKLRYQRMLARGRFAGENESYLRKRDRREVGLGLLHVLRRPFVRMDMRGPRSQVPSQARQLAQQLAQSW